MIDLRCKRFLVRRKRWCQSRKADEDGERKSDSGLPLIRITHNLKQSGAIAFFGRAAPRPVGGQWDQSPYLQIDHHVTVRSFRFSCSTTAMEGNLIAVAYGPTHFYFASIF